MSMFYTGIGSRKTPPHIQEWQTEIARRLEGSGYVLRSGGAEGADQAFQRGISHPSRMEIYLPWWGFNDFYRAEGFHVPSGMSNSEEAGNIASTIHPAWERLTRGPRAMHRRNVYQVLGQDLATPSHLVVFWAPYQGNGQVKGGANTAVQLALRHQVPVINMLNATTFDQVWERITHHL